MVHRCAGDLEASMLEPGLNATVDDIDPASP